jgi:hypothetical protein
LSQPVVAISKGRNAARSGLRVALAVVGIVLLAGVAVVSRWDDFKRAGGPSPLSNIAMLETNALNLRASGFAGCPTVQQVIELTPEPARTDLRADTNGIDRWGTPYQIECDHDQLHVFSMGPDKRAGTADDISWKD